MKTIILIVLLLALAFDAPAQSGFTPCNDPLAQGASLRIDSVWSGNSVGFALLTLPDLQIAGYYNASRQLVLASRNLDSTNWYYQTNNTVYAGWDGHNYIAMSLDPLGFLHLSGNMHRKPMIYFRSAQPVTNAAQFQTSGFMRQLTPLWNAASEAESTYPSWFTSPNSEFIFSYRNLIKSTAGNWHLLKYDAATGSFSQATGSLPLFSWINNYSVYPAFTVHGGYVHCLYIWRGQPGADSNYRLSYLRSSNLRDWTDAFGRAVTLPVSSDATLPVIDDVPQRGGLLNGQPQLGFDDHGVPLVAYHKYDASGHSQVYVARPVPASSAWHSVQLTSADWAWKFSGGGCLPPGGHVNNTFVPAGTAVGRSTVAVTMSHASGAPDTRNGGNYVFDSATLDHVIRTNPHRSSHDSAFAHNNVIADPYIAPVTGDKMVVHKLESYLVANAGPRYCLLWETLPGDNRDKPKLDVRGRPISPTPSALILCRARADFDNSIDEFTPLPAHAVRFDGYFEDYIQTSINHWNKGVVPYAGFVQMFRTGRQKFAQGEMWGKAVRSGAMFYRYTQDPGLKAILKNTVADLLSTKRANGSISCSAIDRQPDGPGGDLWERKYVLLGLEEYYDHVEKDPAVLQAMMDVADCTLRQIGPSPKIRIVDQGWSANHIESSTILEPILRLYKLTGCPRYLDFARYIVEEEGGAKGFNIIADAFNDKDPEQIGGSYPKAYEMMSLFEGVLEYYRATGNEHWKKAALNLYHKIRDQEITLVGNGGGDQPFHPKVAGEAWDHTALEQTNPKMQRMMETCTGVTWLKFCGQLNRLTGDPSPVDEIEKYAYNGLIGAMKPEGDGFSYVNRLNGAKTNPQGWGGKINGINVTCCNLNGPMGLACLPSIAVMAAKTGPVINLYNAGTATATTPGGQTVRLSLKTDYPVSGVIAVNVSLDNTERFILKMRIPAWSASTKLKVNGKPVRVVPGTYAELDRKWSPGDSISLSLDMRCRVINAPHGSDRAGDRFQALVRGPIVLARDENIDPDYDKPVTLRAKNGYIKLTPVAKTLPSARMQFRVPTSDGFIQVVDYSTVNNWNGKHIRTWLPLAESPGN